MAKQSVNLSLDGSTVARARRYVARHSISLSSLVNDYLSALPLGDDAGQDELPPTVRRLLGVAKGGGDVEDYYDHQLQKHGG